MPNKYIAFQNANLRDPDGAVIPVLVVQQPDGSFSLGTSNNFKTVAIPFTSGSGGDAVVASTVPINGYLTEVYVDVGTSGSTLDITLAVVQDSGPTVTLLTLTNVAASASYKPKYPTHGPTGAADGGTTLFAIHGTLTVTIAEAGDAKSGTVYVTCV